MGTSAGGKTRAPTYEQLRRMLAPEIRGLLEQHGENRDFLVSAKRSLVGRTGIAATELSLEIDKRILHFDQQLCASPNLPSRFTRRWIAAALALLGAIGIGFGHGLGTDAWHAIKPHVLNLLASTSN